MIRVLSVCGTCNGSHPDVAFLQTGRESILITATLIIGEINMTALICINCLKPFYLFLFNQKRNGTTTTKFNTIPIFKYHVYSIVEVACHSDFTEKCSVFQMAGQWAGRWQHCERTDCDRCQHISRK